MLSIVLKRAIYLFAQCIELELFCKIEFFKLKKVTQKGFK